MKYPAKTRPLPQKPPQSDALYVTRFLEVVRDVKNMRKELAEMRETFHTQHTKAMEKMLKTMEDRISRSLLNVDAHANRLMEQVEQKIRDAKGLRGDPGYTPVLGVDYFNGEDADEEKLLKKLSKELQTLFIKQKDIAEKNVLDTISKLIEPLVEKHVAGVKNEMRTVSSRVAMGGGGGIGTPTPFSFTGDGLTTDFTLPDTPSGNGLAIWAYYNGQWLQPSSHFTVNGRTFSTTFTAEDGTIIEGFLIP